MTLPGETAQQVVAHVPDAGTTGPSLGLNGHVDVVPAGPRDMWTRPPFEAVREGNWLYGRGAGDMKAGVAANIFALDAIRAAGFAPAGPVQIQSVTEEESTGNGALSVLTRGHNPDATLTPEPMGETLVSANVGVMWFRIALRGRPAHVAYATTGANAIEAAAPVIAALRRLEADWNAARGSDPDFADHPHPINVNVGKIAGGDWPSSVPAWCTLDCRAALFPGQDPDAIRREIETAIADAAAADPVLSAFPPEVSWTGFSTRGFRLPPGTAAEAALSLAAGRAVPRVPSTAYLDARVFQVHGQRPSLVYGPVAEEIHGFDERVDIESIRRVTHTMAQFVARWCGLVPLRRQV